MDYSNNPFYANPYIESIGNNLIKAFNDDGRGAENQARTKLLGAQTLETQQKSAGREASAAAFQGFDPSQPVSAQFLQNAYAGMVRSGVDPAHASAAVLGMTANGGAPDGVVARSFVGAGHAIGKDQGFSIADREGIAKRDDAAALNRTATSAGIAAGASRANNADTLAFHERHAFDAPVQVAPEHAIYPNANDPRMKGVVPGSMPVPRMVTAFDAASPSGASRQPDLPGVATPIKPEHLITQFDATSPTGGVRAMDKPGVIPAAPAERTPKLSSNELANIQFNALSNIPGVIDPATKTPDPEFMKQYGTKILPALQAAGEMQQKNKSAAEATAEFYKVLGASPGMSWGGGGWFSDKKMTPSAPVVGPAGTTQDAPTVASQFVPQLPATAHSAALDEARAAIAKGAPLAAVIQRLKQAGVDPSGLTQQNANDGAR